MACDMLFLVLSGFYRVACNHLNDIRRNFGQRNPDLRQAKALEQWA